MVLKMARGAIETVRIQNMQDLVHAFNAMYMRWVRKYGPEVAGQRYEDLLARVKFDSAEAQVAVQEVGKTVWVRYVRIPLWSVASQMPRGKRVALWM